MRLLLRVISLVVPSGMRARWREEWQAEVRHGGRRMLPGALPDAWTVRRLARQRGPRGNRNPLFGVGQDTRYALRGLFASHGFVAGVVLSLCIGIAANVTAFSFINAAVFRPYPGVRDQHELVRIKVGAFDARGFQVSMSSTGAAFDQRVDSVRQAFTSLESLSAHYNAKFAITAGDQTFAGPGGLVSSNYFDVLGVRPAAGRFFSTEEDSAGAAPVAVLGYAAWERLFAKDPAAVGQTLVVNGAAVQIIGVAAEHFVGVRRNDVKTDVWIPMGLARLSLRDKDGREADVTSARAVFDFVGRRRDGVSVEQVNAEARVIADRIKQTGSSEYTYSAQAAPVWLNDPAEVAPAILGFMAIPLLVLAIACVNAANLLLARAARQARDWTVRVALGASRWRVIRQVLIEALVLAGASAALGLVLARWTIEVAARQIPVPLPIDYRVVAFTLALTICAAIGFSLGPAFSVLAGATKRMAPGRTSAATPRSRLRFGLVALQAALSLALLTTGAQFTNTVFAASENEAVLPDPDRLVIASFDLDPLRMEAEEREQIYRRIADRVRMMPGVTDAGFSTPGLLTGVLGKTIGLQVWTDTTPPEGSKEFLPMLASPGVLPAIGVTLLAGRHFDARDTTSFRTAVVNQVFARKFFAGPAVGRSLRVVETTSQRVHEVTIVGVVGGAMRRTDTEAAILYHPLALESVPARTLHVRADGTGSFSAAALQAAVRDVDARVPVVQTSTLAESRTWRNPERKLLAKAAGVLGLVALLLAAGGLYGVVSYVVSLRRQEIGIRLALGAEPQTIVRLITRQALIPTLIGALVGLLGAAVTGLVVRARFYGVSPVDPVAFGGATLLLLAVMFGATILPARRAARVDPVQTLRTE